MIEKLAFSLGRNDELPNIELAQQLCKENNAEGIKEIVDGLKIKDKRIANDCIKVLYEIGEKKSCFDCRICRCVYKSFKFKQQQTGLGEYDCFSFNSGTGSGGHT